MDWSARLDDKGYHKTAIRRPDTMAVWDCDVRTAADGWVEGDAIKAFCAAAGQNHELKILLRWQILLRWMAVRRPPRQLRPPRLSLHQSRVAMSTRSVSKHSRSRWQHCPHRAARRMRRHANALFLDRCASVS